MVIKLQQSNIHDPLTFDVGDDWVIKIFCTNSDGTPMDLTGAPSVVWKLESASTRSIMFTLVLGNGISMLQPFTLGICVVWLKAAQTATLAPGPYFDKCVVTMA